MSYQNRRRPIKGGKVEVKYLNKLLNESYKGKSNTKANIDDRYILDNELSTDKTKVYIDKITNDIAMVNRGTSDFKDVMTDAKLLFGYNDKRFNEPKEILGKIKQKYTDKNIDVLGHSLAGAVAETLGDDPQVKNVITLNKAITPTHLINKTKNVGKQYDIRSSKDVVSMLQPFQKTENDIVIPSLSNNLYTEHKIDILNRLPQDLVIGTGLKGKKSFEKYFNNLVLIEYMKLMNQ
jgi:predicted esterase YcpF (UPF0227 family)